MKNRIRIDSCHVAAMKWLRLSLFLLFGLVLIPMYGQSDITIRGKVVSATDQSELIGVNVLLKGTSSGTITDVDGNFQLKVSPNATLVFSYIGYNDLELNLTPGKTQYTVAMTEDSQLIDEVVVVGYGVQKKKLVTGATVQVKGDDIARMNTVSPLTALQSQTPGVNITKTSGQPGEGFKVIIRGIGTTGSSNPLYIVDGVARGNIDYLNPADIESLDVLKDAASAAIYGARAANGVILVTTKQGREGKASIQYDGYYGVQNVYKKLNLLNATDYAMIRQEGQSNDNMEPLDFDKLLAPGDWKRIQEGKWNGTNWLNEMENKNAPIQSHSLNISGGTQQSVYSMGLSYTAHEGIFGKPVEPHYDRYTARINSEHTLYRIKDMDVIKVGENLSYSYSEKKGLAIGNMYGNNISSALQTNPMLPMWARDENGNDIVGEYHQAIPLLNVEVNPIGKMVYENGNNLSKNHNLNGNIYAVIQPIRNLKFRTNFGYNFSASSYRSFSPKYHLGDAAKRDNNSVYQSMSTGLGWTFENTLSYDFTIKDTHNFNTLIGMSAERGGLGESINGTNEKLIFDSFKYAYLDNAKLIIPGQTTLGGAPWEKTGLMSYFGRINYDYKETYMLTVVMRADGSSNFAKGNRWGYFPSVSAGWVLSNEKFMENITDKISFLKIRASWGQNGNQSITPFQYLSTIAMSNNDYFPGQDKGDKQTGSYPDIMPNPDVTWETSEQLDLGLDARFFDHRLSFTFDWYHKKTKDWLVQAPVLASYGTAAPYINGGDVVNKGVELSLGWRDNINDFNYSALINLSHNKNEVTRIANTEKIIHSGVRLGNVASEFARAEEGYPIGYFYGYQTDGLFQTPEDVQNYKNSEGVVIMPNAVPGDVRFVDRNDDGIIDDKDKTMIGKSNPDYNLGINLNMSYKGFDLTLVASGVFGNDILRAYRMPDSPSQNYTSEILGRWTGPGTSNSIPRISSGNHINRSYISDLYLEDGSYVRMSNVTLGYDFKKLWKSLPFEQVGFYISAQNLFTITGYSGMDPEIGTSTGENWISGVDFGFYPTPRTFMVGASIKF